MKHMQPLNDYFYENPMVKNVLLIIGGALSDILVVGVLTYWALHGKSWRMPISLVFLYTLRHITSVRIAVFIANSLHFVVRLEDQIS